MSTEGRADRTIQRPALVRWSVACVFVAVTVILLARPLFGLGVLLPTDIRDQAAPWRDEQIGGQVDAADNPLLSDTLDVHTHFASVAEEIRAGEASWWDRSVGGGIPTLKAGFSPLQWLYLLVPGWYAPGLVAAARTLLAAALTYGWMRSLRVHRPAAATAGVAYALSGFMIGWSGWPQSNVAALLPGLFWAVERLARDGRLRDAVPMTVVIGAMVVSNFPLVTAYGLLAAAGYGLWRARSVLAVTTGRSRALLRRASIAAWAVGLGVLISSLHILSFGEYFSWADTSARERIRPDTSIGAEYLASIPFPRPFGASHTGPEFWGPGQNWVETQSYAGFSVLVLAVLATATGTRRRGASGAVAQRGNAVRVLWVIAFVGAWVTYIGGPLTEAIQSLPLLGQNAVGRARVVVNLALAALAGLGVQAWLDRNGERPGIDIARAVRNGLTATLAVGVLLAPAWWRWIDGARDRGLLKETLGGLVVPVVAGALIVTLFFWSSRRSSDRQPGRGRPGRGRPGLVPAAVLAVVAVELLAAGMGVATVVDRDEAEFDTPAHEAAAALLGPGERIGADARTFFANSAQMTGIDDVRGHLLTPRGWREVYRALDPDHFRPPGSVTNPWFRDVDPSSEALDRLGVGLWAADPTTPIAGDRLAVPTPDGVVEVQRGSPPSEVRVDGRVPTGGVRALSFVLEDGAEAVLGVAVNAGATHIAVEQRMAASRPDARVDVALPGFDARAGSTLDVQVSVIEGGPVRFAAQQGQPVGGIVAGGDGLRIARTGDVVLYERSGVMAARLAHGVVTRDPPVPADVHLGSLGAGVATVDSGTELELPDVPPAGARGDAEVIEADGDVVEIRVSTTHAALVIVAQPDYPGWTATVDGGAADVIEADGAFAAVAVPAGEHLVRLRYRPTHLNAAAILTVAGVILLLATWIAGRRERTLHIAPPRPQ